MWESRVLCEISKDLWKPFFGFHRSGISIAVFVILKNALELKSGGMLYPYPPVDRRS